MRVYRCVTLVLLMLLGTLAIAQQIPERIGDEEFWRLVTELSEPGGTFPQQLMSNEDSAHVVIPALKETVPRNGIYIGVGSEQNFTYIAAMQPSLAFVVDIRRENMIEHLMYKALFELSSDRADFVSRLFARGRPAGVGADTGVTALFEAYQTAPADSALTAQNVRDVVDHLANTHKIPLTEPDRAAISGMMNAFRMAGPYTLKGFGDATNPTFAQLMSATDLSGRQQSFLSSEENFRIVQQLHRRNLIVPLVGDFAGDKAIPGIARYLKERGATVQAFYVSNVERYLFEQGEHGRRFYANAATLPIQPSSIFIRSVTSDISRRLGIPIPDSPSKWRSFLFSLPECLDAVASGRIQAYKDLFALPSRP